MSGGTTFSLMDFNVVRIGSIHPRLMLVPACAALLGLVSRSSVEPYHSDVTLWRRVLELYPDSPSTKQGLADALVSSAPAGRMKTVADAGEAERLLRKVLQTHDVQKLGPAPYAEILLANLLKERAGGAAEAKQHLQTALGSGKALLKSVRGSAHNDLGVLMLLQGETTGAFQRFDHALQVFESSAKDAVDFGVYREKVLVNLAMSSIYLNRPNDCSSFCNKSISVSKYAPHIEAQVQMLYAACLYIQISQLVDPRGRFEEDKSAALATAVLHPAKENVKVADGDNRVLSNLKEAMRASQVAVRLQPNNEDAKKRARIIVRAHGVLQKEGLQALAKFQQENKIDISLLLFWARDQTTVGAHHFAALQR
eukprot:gnl/MRDRNA2_/MRDRNA2_22007_c0_seq2.p1 gnl/MRDRNA2_/MRDRNA2_22007_c0~~gnl/MRDRNA2_/MRDRNA2_22007_c0_seq2.p1  ORF type:complete len:368 (-),score=79.65 gnl/MRDRNA2_/MRDRNA2_22007_c0_seq2:18-1121(-)